VVAVQNTAGAAPVVEHVGDAWRPESLWR
jgi:hypothetical protein